MALCSQGIYLLAWHHESLDCMNLFMWLHAEYLCIRMMSIHVLTWLWSLIYMTSQIVITPTLYCGPHFGNHQTKFPLGPVSAWHSSDRRGSYRDKWSLQCISGYHCEKEISKRFVRSLVNGEAATTQLSQTMYFQSSITQQLVSWVFFYEGYLLPFGNNTFWKRFVIRHEVILPYTQKTEPWI